MVYGVATDRERVVSGVYLSLTLFLLSGEFA